MYVQLIEVPYDTGRWGVRMGRGPAALLAAGAAQRVRDMGHAVEQQRVQKPVRFPAEIATGFQVAEAVGVAVRAAAWHRRFPLVLAGNCLSAVGVLAGLRADDVAVVWLDAHADFHTPETTTSGMLDGMALAAAAGHCWTGITATLDGFRPVPADRIVLVGARALEPAEEARVAAAGLARAGADTLDASLARLSPAVRRAYLHVDLDVLDPAFGRANGMAAPGGLTPTDVAAAIGAVRRRLPIAAATLSAYDPEHDPDGTVAEAALQMVEAMLDEAA